jgi:hypothetical protein
MSNHFASIVPQETPIMTPDEEPQARGDRAQEGNASLPAQIGVPSDEMASLAQKTALLGEDDQPDGNGQETGWYVGRLGRSHEGPYSRKVLRLKADLGELLPEDLLWSPGLPGWVPARDIQDLFPAHADNVRVPPLPWEERPDLRTTARLLMQKRLSPQTLRILGRFLLGLATMIACVSLLLVFWQITWFSGAIWLLLTSVVCEIGASVLERTESAQAYLYHGSRHV